MKTKVMEKVERILQDSAKCNEEFCAYMLRNHAMGILELALELELIDEDEKNDLLDRYPI